MVSFTGGEPLVDTRLEEIISLFDTKSTLMSCTSNGTLLTEDRARILKSSGLDSFVISLDGPDPETNDPIRGRGTYKKVMESIRIAKSYGFIVMIIHTLSHQSIRTGNFIKLINLAESLDIPIHVSLASPTGNWSNDEAMKDFILTKEDIDYLWKCQAKYPFLRRDLDGNYRGTGCPAGTERFVISPTGEVMPCTKIQASFGNVKTESMYVIRQKMAKIDHFNSSPKLCLPAEDDTFLRTYLPRVFNKKDLPISYKEFFK
jgi:MoaA/NifB/PqqE/SkfB family radical SAM enzyme